MATHNRTGRSKKPPRHVRLYCWLMESAAWQSLNGNQRSIYVLMAARYNGFNNGRIPFGVRDAAQALHIGKATAAREIAVLKERGFIVPTLRGAFSLKTRQSTEWRLTEFCDDRTHDLPTKDFMRWRPEIQNTVPPQAGTVPVVKPFGIPRETEPPKNGPDSTCRGTVAPKKAVSRSHHKYTSNLPDGDAAVAVDAGHAVGRPTGAGGVSNLPTPDAIADDGSIPPFLRRS